jgi:GTP-binding protein EngB required for normal cell division
MQNEKFNVELTEWFKLSNAKTRTSFEERNKFANYLNDKYMCNQLDKMSSTKMVKSIRYEMLNIIDKIGTNTYLPFTNTNTNTNTNVQLLINELSELEEKESRIPVDNINLCFVGGVSTGKSTVLNGIFCEELTQCKIKRTTMVPTVYIENASNIDLDPDEIFKQISEKNKEIIEKTESGQKLDKNIYKELVFNVGKLDINILEGSYVNVYDIPGLNDARTKDIYYDYLENNFHKFNLVVFLVDIHSGLNTSDEMDMLKFITTNTRDQFETNGRQIYTLVVVNKADDMQTDEDSDKLEITGELKEMYEQVENTITKEFASKNIKDNLIGIIPLCAIDAYLYRMVNKHGRNFKLSPDQILKIGVNENGKKFSTLKPATQETRVYDILKDQTFINTMIKLSGFSRLESILHKFLQENDKGSKLRIDNLLYELKKLPTLASVPDSHGWFDITNMLSLVKQYCTVYDNIKKIDKVEHNAIVTSFVSEMINILKHEINTWPGTSITKLIDSYNTFIEVIINPYFSEYYNVSEYPAFLTEHVISMINTETNDRLTINSIIKHLHILIKINMFTKDTIEQLFKNIMSNVRAENAIAFYKGTDNKGADNKGSDEHYITELIQLLEQCSKKDVVLSEFLRFLIINQLNFVGGDLYIKELLYAKYGELPISSYICMKFKPMPTIQQIIQGLKLEDFHNSNNELDLYYLNYEKEHNSINFTN